MNFCQEFVVVQSALQLIERKVISSRARITRLKDSPQIMFQVFDEGQRLKGAPASYKYSQIN